MPHASRERTRRRFERRLAARFRRPDAGGARERIEACAELIVAVANQEPWPRAAGGRVTSCCVTQACDGKRVVAASTTLRVASSMNTNAKIERKNTSKASRK